MFAKIQNNQVIDYPVDLRRAYPNVSFPAKLDALTNLPDGIVRVKPSAPPSRKFATVSEKTPALVNGEWVQQWDVQEIPLEDAKARLKAAAAAKRWEVETSGLTLDGGIRVLTGIEDQNRIDAALTSMERYELESIEFKAASGWVTLTLQQLRDIGEAVAQHVQACFAAERVHCEAIDELESIEDAESYDVNDGWPPVSNS